MARVSAHELTRTTDCRVAGCDKESLGALRGPYANLCADHTKAARQKKIANARGISTTSATPPPEPSRNGHSNGGPPVSYEDRVRQLLPVAKQVDRAVASHRRAAPALEKKQEQLRDERVELDQTVIRALREFKTMCRELAGEREPQIVVAE